MCAGDCALNTVEMTFTATCPSDANSHIEPDYTVQHPEAVGHI
jgi:hypothetical protein